MPSPVLLNRLLLQRLLTTAKTLLMLTALALAGTWCLTSTLDDMTRLDCQRGISSACKHMGLPTPTLSTQSHP
jgi:hypothetical protein